MYVCYPSSVIPSLGESKKELRKLNMRNLVGHLVVKDCYGEYDVRTAKGWIYDVRCTAQYTTKGWIYDARGITRHTAKGWIYDARGITRHTAKSYTYDARRTAQYTAKGWIYDASSITWHTAKRGRDNHHRRCCAHDLIEAEDVRGCFVERAS